MKWSFCLYGAEVERIEVDYAYRIIGYEFLVWKCLCYLWILKLILTALCWSYSFWLLHKQYIYFLIILACWNLYVVIYFFIFEELFIWNSFRYLECMYLVFSWIHSVFWVRSFYLFTLNYFVKIWFYKNGSIVGELKFGLVWTSLRIRIRMRDSNSVRGW